MGSSDIATALAQLHQRVRVCRLCPLHLSRTKAAPGEGPLKAEVMFIGEAPGYEEDQQGRPFVGAAGKLLTEQLRRIGLTREEVFITNIVKCRPPGNRDPNLEEIETCNDYLLAQIALLEPRIICTLGRFAMHALIDPSLSITREHGRERSISGIKYLPIYHPAAALHQARLLDALEKDFDRLRTILE